MVPGPSSGLRGHGERGGKQAVDVGVAIAEASPKK